MFLSVFNECLEAMKAHNKNTQMQTEMFFIIDFTYGVGNTLNDLLRRKKKRTQKKKISQQSHQSVGKHPRDSDQYV